MRFTFDSELTRVTKDMLGHASDPPRETADGHKVQ